MHFLEFLESLMNIKYKFSFWKKNHNQITIDVGMNKINFRLSVLKIYYQ